MPKKTPPREIAVFIASPGDLANERKQFRDAIDQLNDGFADGADVKFEALGWEDTLASTGRRNQDVINQDIDRCDVFILVMHRRWGQPAPDAEGFSSYTEEEFYRALERWKKEKSPEIFVFFKRVDAGQEADPGPQLQKVMDFRRQLEDTKQVLYRYTDDGENAFSKEVNEHLRAYAKGELSTVDTTRKTVVFPLDALEEVKEAKAEAKAQAEAAEEAKQEAKAHRLRLEELQLETAEEAAKQALEGMVEHARQKFTKLISDTSNTRVLFLAYEFFKRTGALDTTVDVLEHWLSLSGPDVESISTAAACGNLGNVYRTRGRLDEAQAMYTKALAINEALDHKEGMACDYGNLGNLYRTRGELDKAQVMYRKTLAIEEGLGRKESMAKAYGNLGVLYATRGKLDEAQAMYKKALMINEETGSEESAAVQYGNLGNLHQRLGELDEAQAMYKKALAIDEALGMKVGMAIRYGNLGNLYRTRGELNEAEILFKKALALNEVLGRKEGMASQYGNLGNLHRTRGEFDKAESMYRKALELFESLGVPQAETVQQALNDLREE